MLKYVQFNDIMIRINYILRLSTTFKKVKGLKEWHKEREQERKKRRNEGEGEIERIRERNTGRERERDYITTHS